MHLCLAFLDAPSYGTYVQLVLYYQPFEMAMTQNEILINITYLKEPNIISSNFKNYKIS